MKVLGIETSCDETAVAIVDDQKNILSHALNSQIDLHQKFGGVVPELAARSHAELIDALIVQALKQANLKFEEIDGFAATCGPGLIGGVIVGMMAAKTLASVFKKPFLAVNHLEAHALTARLTSSDLQFPYLLLLVSGGHCQILLTRGVGDYKKFGETIDDAVGEAFDKVAKMLGLDYPGGPAVEKLAQQGDEKRFKLPRPLIDGGDKNHRYDFSFSGLKTAVRREIEKLSKTRSPSCANLGDDVQLGLRVFGKFEADLCASFQRTVAEVLQNRLENVWRDFDEVKSTKKLVIAGGVAANRYIFAKLQNWALSHDLEVITPPLNLCTDNAAMIAWAGIEKLRLQRVDSLDFKPKARWSLA